MDDGESRRPGLPEIAAALAAVTTTLASAWMMMAPQERYWVRLQALGTARGLMARLARRAGRRGMADELAGRDYQRYQVAYWLGRGRDRLSAAIEDMRP